MSMGDFPKMLSQRILVEIILVGRLGAHDAALKWPSNYSMPADTGRYHPETGSYPTPTLYDIDIYIYIYIEREI